MFSFRFLFLIYTTFFAYFKPEKSDLDDANRGMIIVCSATHKTKTMFFFFVQSEQGDIFKITLKTEESFVTEIRVKYFDTVPVASSMCVLKTGFLFIASEFSNQ